MEFVATKSLVLHLSASVIILVLGVCAEDSRNATISSKQSFCVFPEFLQTSCSPSSKICEWTFGERIALPLEELSSPQSEFQAVRGTTQWSWKVLNSTIFASFMQESKPRTKNVRREYYCIEKYGKNNDTFIISRKDLSTDHGHNINNKFNCIRFLPRGNVVVQYKLGIWVHTIQNVSCLENNTALQEHPLISDRYFGVLDCPHDLRGGFEILHIYDTSRKRLCHYPKGNYGILESECLSKDGLIIDFRNTHNCTNPSLGSSYPRELKLQCHSRPWVEKNTTFVITSRQARWLYEYEKTTFQCLMFNSNQNQSEFDVYLINEPKCGRFMNDGQTLDITDALVLRVRRKTRRLQKSILSRPDRCKFPAALQGLWLEESNHRLKTLQINHGTIIFQSGDNYQCKERFVFKYKYSGCDRGEDRWPLHGRIGFYYDDYTLISEFQNGCRPRITRLGLSGTVDNRVLVYRLSQSEPIVDDGRSAQDYYDHEILKRMCAMIYLYKRDPYPYWGRNIEKIIHRPTLSPQPIEKCSLVFNNRLDFLSTVAVTQSSECQGVSSKIYFGCKEPRGTPKTIKIAYNTKCRMKDLKFQCIGRAWKFGHFILVRDAATQRLNCIWFDKESKAILRLDSPQCSDVDFGQLPGHSDKFAERFQIKYFERCPHIPDPTVRAKIAIGSNAEVVSHNILMTAIALLISML